MDQPVENNTYKITKDSRSFLKDHYIVAIGASAGGLEAINQLFDNMPANTGFSFVVIQHLSPDHKSMMNELLARHTTMQIQEAHEDLSPLPNRIYLIPPGKLVTLENGRFRLEKKTRDQQPQSIIDGFLESLAIDVREKAVAIILSGTGSDGTRGLKAIKNNGGIAIAQDPVTAQFDGMPNSAVSSGLIDLVLSPDMIAADLVEHVREAPFVRSLNNIGKEDEKIIAGILGLVYTKCGIDFSNYKRPTIMRRLAKRMSHRNIKNLLDYYEYLQQHPNEVTRLNRDLLLNVTRFFRDEEAFDKLRESIIPMILAKKTRGDTVKVWTAGCSTGEEAYSLAMLFDECLRDLKKEHLEIKIFASDISQDCVDSAARGIYSKDQLKHLSPDRTNRYFTKEHEGYKIIPEIRKMIVFAKHDMVKDPPYGKIDLMVCRNVLIYMSPDLQKNILQKFHFAVTEGGYIFLGPSENIGILKDLTSEVDKKWKIYKCETKMKPDDFETFTSPEFKVDSLIKKTPKSKNPLSNISDLFKETLLEESNYAGILIDKNLEVKQAVGNYKRFIDLPDGAFNLNLLKLVPNELSIALSTSIRKASKENTAVIQHNVLLNLDDVTRSVTVIVKPYLLPQNYLQPFLFIVLKEKEEIQNKKKAKKPGATEDLGRIQELEEELNNTRENLQSLLEEVESANEELQSGNEEIISANEELQSTNEELQSLNEELHTVNAEHQQKIRELMELNDDLNNYFRNSEVGQLFIDSELRVRKYTPIATRQVNLIPGDVGRLVSDISTNLLDVDLAEEIKSVISNNKIVDKEVTLSGGKIYQMKILPYLRQNNTIDGAVVNFINITEVKRIHSLLEAVFNSSTSAIIVFQSIRNRQGSITDFKVLTANRSYQFLFGNNSSLADQTYRSMPEYEEKWFETLVHVVESGYTRNFKMLQNNTGKLLDIIAVKLMDGLVVTINDITEKRAIQNSPHEVI